MDYNTTAINSSSNIYPTAYLSNSSRTPSFSSIIELYLSLSPQVLIHVQQSPKKQASDTRCRYIFHVKDITRTYRNQSRSSSSTDSEGCLDVSASPITGICGMIPSCHGNTSAEVTNNQPQKIQLNFYSLHYDIMQLLNRNISKLER